MTEEAPIPTTPVQDKPISQEVENDIKEDAHDTLTEVECYFKKLGHDISAEITALREKL